MEENISVIPYKCEIIESYDEIRKHGTKAMGKVIALLGKGGNILDPSTLICLTRCVGVAGIILNINFRNQNRIRVVPKGRRNIQPLRQKSIIG